MTTERRLQKLLALLKTKGILTDQDIQAINDTAEEDFRALQRRCEERGKRWVAQAQKERIERLGKHQPKVTP